MSPRHLLRAVFVACLGVLSSCGRTDVESNTAFEAPTTNSPGGSVPPEETLPLVGKPAPGVEGTLLDESKFSLQEQFASNIVMLDFWATWCGPCIAELPILIKLAEEYKTKGVVLFAVNQDEDPETIRKFLQEMGWKLNVVLDPGGKHATAYGVDGIPQLVLIGRDGVVKKLHVGYGEGVEQLLRQELDSILAAPTTPTAPSAKPGS